MSIYCYQEDKNQIHIKRSAYCLHSKIRIFFVFETAWEKKTSSIFPLETIKLSF